jgi:CheY-like chemotaxis protein
VILMTAHYTTETAVEAIQKGASDYLNKPISIPALRGRVEKLLDDARPRQRALSLDGELMETSRFEGLIGRSPLMWDLFARIRRVAPHYRSAFITGPTGTGKDLVAKALHNLSPANSGRFLTCTCSAVVETLFESELFGYVKGAFTGAAAGKMGLMEFAHGGTLYLDEIGHMPLSTHAGQVAQSLAESGSHAGWFGDAPQSGRPGDRRHQSRRPGFDCAKAIPRGSVLSAGDGGVANSHAGGAARGSSAAREVSPAPVLKSIRQRHPRAHAASEQELDPNHTGISFDDHEKGLLADA